MSTNEYSTQAACGIKRAPMGYTPLVDNPQEANEPAYVLEATSRYLLSCVYGDYALTALHRTERSAMGLALTAFGSWATPIPLAFTAPFDRQATFVMLLAALSLYPSPYMTLTSVRGRVPNLMVSADPIDVVQRNYLDSCGTPTRSRTDLTSMRRRLRSTARYVPKGDAATVLRWLGDEAGPVWCEVAEVLVKGMNRPVSEVAA